MTRRPACASATAAPRIGINSPCQSPSGAIAWAISGALRVLAPACDNTSMIDFSREPARGESGADMHDELRDDACDESNNNRPQNAHVMILRVRVKKGFSEVCARPVCIDRRQWEVHATALPKVLPATVRFAAPAPPAHPARWPA